MFSFLPFFWFSLFDNQFQVPIKNTQTREKEFEELAKETIYSWFFLHQRQACFLSFHYYLINLILILLTLILDAHEKWRLNLQIFWDWISKITKLLRILLLIIRFVSTSEFTKTSKSGFVTLCLITEPPNHSAKIRKPKPFRELEISIKV